MTAMGETVEVRTERLARRMRTRTYYDRWTLSNQRCRYCRLRLPLALTEAGIDLHPTCGPDAAELLRIDKEAIHRTA